MVEIARYMPRSTDADVAKLVDAPDLGSGAARRGGSSPSIRTKLGPGEQFSLGELELTKLRLVSFERLRASGDEAGRAGEDRFYQRSAS